MPTSTASRPRCSACRSSSVFETLRGLSRLGLRQRLQLSRPHLPGDGAGRRRRSATTSATSRNLKTRNDRGRDGAARLGRDLPRHHRPLPRAALQPLSRRPRCRARPCPASRPARRSPPWSASRPRCCPTASASNGPSSPTRRSSPATPALLVFGASVVFVFLLLAAQYESWSLPLAVILIVPMCLLAAITGAAVARHGHQHPGADRLRRAGRPRRQERDPDRRVRQAGARRRA